MRKIILFVPYYGNIPNYFPAWCHSIKHLDGFVDFVFVTDLEVSNIETPNNLKVIFMPFQELKKLIERKNITPPMHPYKLCDFKPVYGTIFSEFITDEYNYWGYCDIDTLFGDIKGFLQKIDYTKFDRIGEKGHFTIYRNNDSTKNLFRYKIKNKKHPYYDFDYVCGTTYACHFDEIGMNYICEENGLNFYRDNHEINTTEACMHIHTFGNRTQNQLLIWQNGHVYDIVKGLGGVITKEEKMYIHFQYQKDMPVREALGPSILVTPEGFINFDESQTLQLLDDIGRPDTQEEATTARKTYTKKLRRARNKKILREFKYCGIRAIYNYAVRVNSFFDVIFKYHNL